jgi:group I intron endonuclease
LKKQGIYKISSPSGKIYIGQSINIIKRWNEHKNYAGIGPKLKHSYEKYGFDNHKKEIIEECSLNQLDNKETFWKQYYLDQVEGNYNKVLFNNLYDLGKSGPWNKEQKQKHQEIFKNRVITWDVGRKEGYIMSEEEKEKRRKPKSEEAKQNMRKPRSEQGKLNMRVSKPNSQKPVFQYNFEGNFIKEWKSITDAYLFFGKSINSSGITCCLKGKQKTAYGFIWKEQKI